MTSPRSPSRRLASGALQFTIDQQPYLQGFLPILQLYMYKASQSLTGIADVNTGLKFLDKTTVAPYNSTKSRYEGTSTSRRGHEVVGYAAGRRWPPRRTRRSQRLLRRAQRRLGPARRGAEPRAALPDAARGQHHRGHADRVHLLRDHAPATS